MIFTHRLTLANEKIYSQNIETLKQTKNELKFYYQNYAFYSTVDNKLHPCYYPQSAYRFLKFGDIALATDFIDGGLSAIPVGVVNAVIHMQQINKTISDDRLLVMSCDEIVGRTKYFDYIIFLKSLNAYIKVFERTDIQFINNLSFKSIESLNLPENDIINPYDVLVTNSGEIILRARSAI